MLKYVSRRNIRGMARISPTSGGGSTHITMREPKSPPDSDFAIYIDFLKGTDHPERVFQAADNMIRALQNLDRALCTSIDSNLEPIMLLEEIQSGSIKIWLSNQLNRVDDDALKKLDWKPLVGKYLVRAKYAFIKWSNKEGEDGSLLNLSKDIAKIAEETDVRQIPAYAPPSTKDLADSARAIDNAKGFLKERDKISYISQENPPIDFNLSIRWAPDELKELTVKEKASFRGMPMILIVKRPDYLGKAKWDFRHGRNPLSASIEDEEWLRNFQNRRIDVRPGDALRCLVDIEHSYGHNGELVSEDHTIVEVQGIEENNLFQDSFDL